MFPRLGGYVVPSLLAHGMFFAALGVGPSDAEPPLAIESVEYFTITEDGGGRVGNDTTIGDATEPEAVPEKKFRQVRRAKSKVTPAGPKAAPTPEAASPNEGSVETGAEGGEGGVAPSHSMAMGSAGSDPNATRAGVGTGAEGVARRDALRAWLREIQREVNKIATRNYPASAVRMRLEGKLRLGITIGDDGSILGVRVLTSSGHEVLDDSARKSVMALHIPAPPSELRWRKREISLPIRYALD
ncbi:MAG: energy transducer TonB [Myxococcota bacterium]